MMLLLMIAGCVAALVVVYVVATQTKVEEALAAETTVAGAADPSAETISTGRFTAPRPSEVRSEWQLATVNNLSDAEELLDVLENNGVAERELVVLGNTCFAVRWR